MSSLVEKIPSGWTCRNLGSMGDFFGGVTSISKEDYDHGTPFLPFKNVFNNSKVDIKALELMNVKEKDLIKRNCLYGDIFFTASSETDNEVAMSSVLLNNVENLTYNGFCKRYRLHSFNELNPNFARYFFRSRVFRYLIKQVVTGDVRFNISQETLSNIKVTIPKNIEEQKAIANILSAFDDKIENLEDQNKTLEKTAQTIFQDWFKSKSEDWELVKINELVEISSSKRIFYSEYVNEGIPFYRSKEVIELSTKPDISTELFITEERYNEIKHKFDVPIKGDILLTAVGTLGVVFQVRNNKPFYFKDGNLIWFKNFSNKLSSGFLYNWLKLKSTQHLLNIVSIGSTQKALTITSIKDLEIPFIINNDKRKILNAILNSNLAKVNHNQSQIQNLKRTRDALLPKLMSGKLRVNDFKD